MCLSRVNNTDVFVSLVGHCWCVFAGLVKDLVGHLHDVCLWLRFCFDCIGFNLVMCLL